MIMKRSLSFMFVTLALALAVCSLVRAQDAAGDRVVVPARKPTRPRKGDIAVDGVGGEIDANNMNGKVTLNNVSGTVVAHSLNGALKVSMDGVDQSKPLSFSTLNGSIDVTLPADFKGNVKLSADRGEIYSDFDFKLTGSPLVTQKNDTADGKFRVRVDRTMTGTINGGGTEATFKTFNGKIFIRKKK